MFYTATKNLTHEATRWDRARWALRADSNVGLRDSERVMADVLRDVAEKDSASADARAFAGEVFARLASDPAKVQDEVSWASKVQGVIDELPEFEALRATVQHDADMAALATKCLLDEIAQKLPAMLAAEPESDDEEQGQGSGTPSRERSAMRSALRRAIAKAGEQVTEAREALEGLAPGMGSAPTAMDQDDASRLTLAEMLLNNPAFREVLRRAGKLQRLAQSDAKKRAAGVGTVVGLERGGDLGRVLPSQLGGLRHKRLRTLTQKNIIEASLMQYRIEGHEPQGRGPIVLLVDESCSMAGSPMRWAKAAVIAAIRQGRAEKRPVWIAYFDTMILDARYQDAQGNAYRVTRSAPVQVQERIGSTGDLVTEALRRYEAGGTSFSPAFQWALDVLEGGEDRADLVIVTDGQATANKATKTRLSEQRARGTRVYALTVNGGDASTLGDLCDTIVPIDRVPEDEIAQRLAHTVPSAP